MKQAPTDAPAYERGKQQCFFRNGAWVVEVPEPNKESKLTELKASFNEAAETATITSSLGFDIDANAVANQNITGLLITLEDDTTEVLFRGSDNAFHKVTRPNLVTMQKEVIENGQRLYTLKWQYETQIEAAKTQEEVNAITFTW